MVVAAASTWIQSDFLFTQIRRFDGPTERGGRREIDEAVAAVELKTKKFCNSSIVGRHHYKRDHATIFLLVRAHPCGGHNSLKGPVARNAKHTNAKRSGWKQVEHRYHLCLC